MDWLVLLLLVPAIVVPIVLLFGFAGCSSHPQRVASAPTIVSAIPLDAISVELQWTDSNGVPATYEVERTRAWILPPHRSRSCQRRRLTSLTGLSIVRSREERSSAIASERSSPATVKRRHSPILHLWKPGGGRSHHRFSKAESTSRSQVIASCNA